MQATLAAAQVRTRCGHTSAAAVCSEWSARGAAQSGAPPAGSQIHGLCQTWPATMPYKMLQGWMWSLGFAALPSENVTGTLRLPASWQGCGRMHQSWSCPQQR